MFAFFFLSIRGGVRQNLPAISTMRCLKVADCLIPRKGCNGFVLVVPIVVDAGWPRPLLAPSRADFKNVGVPPVRGANALTLGTTPKARAALCVHL